MFVQVICLRRCAGNSIVGRVKTLPIYAAYALFEKSSVTYHQIELEVTKVIKYSVTPCYARTSHTRIMMEQTVRPILHFNGAKFYLDQVIALSGDKFKIGDKVGLPVDQINPLNKPGVQAVVEPEEADTDELPIIVIKQFGYFSVICGMKRYAALLKEGKNFLKEAYPISSVSLKKAKVPDPVTEALVQPPPIQPASYPRSPQGFQNNPRINEGPRRSPYHTTTTSPHRRHDK
jgi:hypothetical protein